MDIILKMLVAIKMNLFKVGYKSQQINKNLSLDGGS